MTPSHLFHSSLFLLPPEWFIIAVISLSILGVLAIIAINAIVLMCYLRRPEKTPAALVSRLNYRKLGIITNLYCQLCGKEKQKLSRKYREREITKLIVDTTLNHIFY